MATNQVKGSLFERNKIWYIVIRFKDFSGKSRKKWISTGLPVKGNKKRAEELLAGELENFNFIQQETIAHDADILFLDYLFMWLDTKKGKVRDISYVGYESQIATVMSPYFAEREYI